MSAYQKLELIMPARLIDVRVLFFPALCNKFSKSIDFSLLEI